MTGPSCSDQVFEDRQRQELRKKRAKVAGVVVLLLVVVGFMVPWLLGRRTVESEPATIAVRQDDRCWVWRVSAAGQRWIVVDPPDAWLGSASVPGEAAVPTGDDTFERPYFIQEAGERYALADATKAPSTCPPPPTTMPLR